jgi:hypothetical protein
LRRRRLSGVAAAMKESKRLRVYAAVLAGLLLWQITEATRISPNFLAYFNAISGGPAEGYRHLVDSSLDWGQDLPGLKKWLDANNPSAPGQSPVFLSYFGNAPPEHYGIHPVYLPGFPDLIKSRVPPPLTGGIYCISATLLVGVYAGEAPGHWTPAYERRYQDVRYNLSVFDSTAGDRTKRELLLRQTGKEFWWKLFHLYEQLRFARLAAYLRERRPDDNVGYSILIYRLSDRDLAAALDGPSPEATAR